MAIQIFSVVFVCLWTHGVLAKSIQNGTIDEGKFVNVETFEAWKKNMTNYISDLLEKESQNQKKRAFFHTRLPSDVTYNKNSVLKFSTVISNEGNHFNPGDSIFISPVNGVYLFSWTTQTYSSKSVYTELRVNNVVKDVLNANLGSTGGLSVTRVVICKVNKDNHVWIQTGAYYSENFFDNHNGAVSSFIGVLLYEI